MVLSTNNKIQYTTNLFIKLCFTSLTYIHKGPKKFIYCIDFYIFFCYYINCSIKTYAGIAQLIERCLAKAEVAGLSPVSRSNFCKLFWFYL